MVVLSSAVLAVVSLAAVVSVLAAVICRGITPNLYVKATTPRSSSTTVSSRGGLTPLAAAPDFQAREC